MAVKRPGRTALGDLSCHRSQEKAYVAIAYGNLRNESTGRSRHVVSQQAPRRSGSSSTTMASNFDCETRKSVSSKPLGNRLTFPARATWSCSPRELRMLKLICPLVITPTCARCHPQVTSCLSPASCFSSRKPNQRVEALVNSGVSVAGTSCPPTIPEICALGFGRSARRAPSSARSQ